MVVVSSSSLLQTGGTSQARSRLEEGYVRGKVQLQSVRWPLWAFKYILTISAERQVPTGTCLLMNLNGRKGKCVWGRPHALLQFPGLLSVTEDRSTMHKFKELFFFLMVALCDMWGQMMLIL